MAFESINPADGETLKVFDTWNDDQIDVALQQVADASRQWSVTSLAERCDGMRRVAAVLRDKNEELARTGTLELD